MKKSERAKALANDLLDAVNCFGFDEETFAETICTGHKTLQQSVMRLFMNVIRKMAEVTPDARNQETVSLAKEIVVIADKYNLPLI